MARQRPIVEQLRKAIRDAEKRGITQYRIAKISGVHAGQLTRLMHGTVGPRLDTAERIAQAIGCEIRVISKKKS